MDRTTWSAGDREWVARYRASMAGKHVPASAREERERELRVAVREAGLPAAELLGDAGALAAGDAAELATVDEAVRVSEGGGMRPVLRDVGGTLLGIGAVAVSLTVVRGAWSVDLDVAHLLVAAGVLVGFMGWVVGRALFSAGRSMMTAGALVAATAIALACIASAARLGPGHVLAERVPVPLLAVALLAPGVVTLLLARRMPQERLRDEWNDTEWLRRFRGGLRARLVPTSVARGHAAEIEQGIHLTGQSAYAEFGHPLVLARELAEANRTARTRRWWLSTAAGTGTPLIIAALVFAMQTWGPLTIPVVVVLLLGAVVTPLVGWTDRPWVKRR